MHQYELSTIYRTQEPSLALPRCPQITTNNDNFDIESFRRLLTISQCPVEVALVFAWHFPFSWGDFRLGVCTVFLFTNTRITHWFDFLLRQHFAPTCCQARNCQPWSESFEFVVNSSAFRPHVDSNSFPADKRCLLWRPTPDGWYPQHRGKFFGLGSKLTLLKRCPDTIVTEPQEPQSRTKSLAVRVTKPKPALLRCNWKRSQQVNFEKSLRWCCSGAK